MLARAQPWWLARASRLRAVAHQVAVGETVDGAETAHVHEVVPSAALWPPRVGGRVHVELQALILVVVIHPVARPVADERTVEQCGAGWRPLANASDLDVCIPLGGSRLSCHGSSSRFERVTTNYIILWMS